MKLFSRKEFLNEGKFDKLFGVDVHQDNLNVSNDGLTELKGMPYEVKGDFRCNNNQLKSLAGCPQIVVGDFLCMDNKLENLENGPSLLYGLFNCTGNPNLTREMLAKFKEDTGARKIISDRGIF